MPSTSTPALRCPASSASSGSARMPARPTRWRSSARTGWHARQGAAALRVRVAAAAGRRPRQRRDPRRPRAARPRRPMRTTAASSSIRSARCRRRARPARPAQLIAGLPRALPRARGDGADQLHRAGRATARSRSGCRPRCRAWPARSPRRSPACRRSAVTVHVTYLGGGFGRRLDVDVVGQAVRIALEIRRPAGAAGLVARGGPRPRLLPPRRRRRAARRRSASDGRPVVAARSPAPATRSRRAGSSAACPRLAGPVDTPDKTASEGLFDLAYEIAEPAHRPRRDDEAACRSATGARSAIRTTRSSANASSTSWPHAAGQDPVAYRLALLKDSPRHRAVLQLAARAGRLAGPRHAAPLAPGRARGVALHESFGSIVAQVVEVVDRRRPAARAPGRLRGRRRHRRQSGHRRAADGERGDLRPRRRAARPHRHRGRRRPADQLPELSDRLTWPTRRAIETHLVASTRAAGRRRRDRHAAARAGARQCAVRADRQAPARAAAGGLSRRCAPSPAPRQAESTGLRCRRSDAHGGPGCGAACGASIGLVRKSFMPAASAWSRSETSAAAVSAMIGSASRVPGLAQLGGGLVAAHHRHLHVHQHQVERPAAARRLVHRLDRGRPSRACATSTPHCASVATAIIMLTGLSSTSRMRASRSRSCSFASLLERVAAAAPPRGSGSSAQKVLPRAGAALDADLAAHQARQLAADRQAEAGAAVAPRRRRVALRERLEQARLQLPRRRRCRCRRPRGGPRRAPPAPASMRMPPAIGELDRVGDEVAEDLADPHRVADDDVGAGRRRPRARASGPWPRRSAGTTPAPRRAARAGRTAARLERELAGLDLREVEDVGEDAVRLCARVEDLLEVVARASPAAATRTQGQPGQAEQAVQRRADLVAGVGEEGALGPARRLGGVARRGERLRRGGAARSRRRRSRSCRLRRAACGSTAWPSRRHQNRLPSCGASRARSRTACRPASSGPAIAADLARSRHRRSRPPRRARRASSPARQPNIASKRGFACTKRRSRVRAMPIEARSRIAACSSRVRSVLGDVARVDDQVVAPVHREARGRDQHRGELAGARDDARRQSRRCGRRRRARRAAGTRSLGSCQRPSSSAVRPTTSSAA